MKIVKVSSSLGGMGNSNNSEKAPELIISELRQFNSNFDVSGVKVDGNLDNLYKNLEQVEGDIFIGGDHGITYGLCNGFDGLLIFDAHPDCEIYTNTATHEDFLRKLIEDGRIKKENIILVGVRNVSKNEKEFLEKNKIKVFYMKDIFDSDIKEICDTVMEMCNKFKRLYLSLDIDVVDPAFAPGVGYLESGGLTSNEILYFVRRLKLLKNLKRFDLVEVIPEKDKNNMTVNLAVRILKEFL